jgi:prepilin peptidase CpaA
MVIVVVLLVISIVDIKFYRIPNGLLILLLGIGAIYGAGEFNYLYLLISIALIALFTFLLRCGMGDSKLAIIVINWVIPYEGLYHYLAALSLISILLLLVHLIKNRAIGGVVAFAPALCGAVLPVLY